MIGLRSRNSKYLFSILKYRRFVFLDCTKQRPVICYPQKEAMALELRVLKYFLVVAREENITRAAALLHVTQPTLSRQLIQLEEELGVKLFHRGKYHVSLTDDGILLRRRAQEIVDLTEKTQREFQRQEGELAGEIAIGAGETNSMTGLSREIAAFRREHPLVRFNLYSATADDIKDRLDKGLLDLGLLAEPVDIGRYEFIRMPKRDRWGAWVRRDDPLAGQESVSPGDLLRSPLLLSRREEVRKELAGWFGDFFEQVEVAATYNLILNAANMVRNGVGVALGFFIGNLSDELRFVPLSPPLETGTVLVWKKDQAFSPAASEFLQCIKHTV